MAKVTNKKEKYSSRSSLVSKKAVRSSGGEFEGTTRSVFSVDTNGYFIWANNSLMEEHKH
jgi:hypothetical protein